MQFKVPQFLEIEDKIFGPFTFKEFVYLAGGAGLCFVLYKILGLFLGFIPMAVVAGFSLSLTFYRPNNKPFINMVEASLKYLMQDKLYIWKKRRIKVSPAGSKGGSFGEVGIKRESLGHAGRLGGNKLRDLAWSLDVLDLNKHSNK